MHFYLDGFGLNLPRWEYVEFKTELEWKIRTLSSSARMPAIWYACQQLQKWWMLKKYPFAQALKRIDWPRSNNMGRVMFSYHKRDQADRESEIVNRVHAKVDRMVDKFLAEQEELRKAYDQTINPITKWRINRKLKTFNQWLAENMHRIRTSLTAAERKYLPQVLSRYSIQHAVACTTVARKDWSTAALRRWVQSMSAEAKPNVAEILRWYEPLRHDSEARAKRRAKQLHTALLAADATDMAAELADQFDLRRRSH